MQDDDVMSFPFHQYGEKTGTDSSPKILKVYITENKI